MSQMTNTGRVKPITSQSMERTRIDQEILQRVTGLIRLGVGTVNILICLRFLLKMMAANPANEFAQLIYRATQPFLLVFQGLIRTVTVDGIVFELHDLIAIAVYGLLGWVAVQLLRVLFARIQ